MAAVMQGDVECVRELIQAGADLNIETDFGRFALRIAVENNHFDCVTMLFKAGAKVTTPESIIVMAVRGIAINFNILGTFRHKHSLILELTYFRKSYM